MSKITIKADPELWKQIEFAITSKAEKEMRQKLIGEIKNWVNQNITVQYTKGLIIHYLDTLNQ